MQTIHATTRAVPAALAGVLLLVAGGLAAICDKTYYMQSGTQTILTGSTPASLQRSLRTTVDKNFAGVEALHAETEYKMITRLKGNGACTDWKKTDIDYATRPKNATAFATSTSGDNSVRLFAGKYILDSTVNFEYWFGIADSVGTSARLIDAIGKLQGESQPHVWYGTATVTQALKDRVLGTPKGSLTRYYKTLMSDPDSAKLQEILLSSWKSEKDNDTQTVTFKVQLVKVTYDSIQPTIGIRGGAAKARSSALVASQSGNLVLIRPGEGMVGTDEALGLFNMMGHRIATLHPTGYLYQWNGRTAAGAEAPPGVYFVQSGSRILGKFFYSR